MRIEEFETKRTKRNVYDILVAEETKGPILGLNLSTTKDDIIKRILYPVIHLSSPKSL